MVGTIISQKETSPLAHYVRNSLPHKSHRFCSPMRKNWSQQLETSKWEPFFLPLLLISFAIHCLAALPNARIEPGDETIKWEPFFLPLLLISFAIHCLAALPNALVVPYCHSLVSRNCIRYMEPSLYTRPRIWIRSLRSLSTLASLAIQIPYPPRRVCADSKSHPPARLVIASLRSL